MRQPRQTDIVMVTSFLFLSLACALVVGACRSVGTPPGEVPVSPQPTKRAGSITPTDEAIWSCIRSYATEPGVPPEVRRRAQAAITREENGTLDREPILVRATLFQGNYAALVLYAVDEDRDILGIRVKEEHVGPGTQGEVIEEQYPIYIRFFAPAPSKPPWIPVKIRDEGQRKDMQAWETYLTGTIEWLIDKYIERNEEWRNTRTRIPTVWMSSLTSEAIRVYVSVYDRRGHQSEYVPVENDTEEPGG